MVKKSRNHNLKYGKGSDTDIKGKVDQDTNGVLSYERERKSQASAEQDR
jgi:hypothetical protein